MKRLGKVLAPITAEVVRKALTREGDAGVRQTMIDIALEEGMIDEAGHYALTQEFVRDAA